MFAKSFIFSLLVLITFDKAFSQDNVRLVEVAENYYMVSENGEIPSLTQEQKDEIAWIRENTQILTANNSGYIFVKKAAKFYLVAENEEQAQQLEEMQFESIDHSSIVFLDSSDSSGTLVKLGHKYYGIVLEEGNSEQRSPQRDASTLEISDNERDSSDTYRELPTSAPRSQTSNQ